MICAACGDPTDAEPCATCGASPVLVGRYRLVDTLGRGRSGTTFRAVRIADGAVVAVKEMPLRRADSDKARALFQREARVLAQLDHPRIPRYLEDFVAGRGKHAAIFLVEELVEGVDLDVEMATRRYDEPDVLDVLAGLLPILAYLHGRSPPVLHRDVKPRNVLRRTDGALVLVDFGAVRADGVDSELGGSTVAGTFGYMAPEQFRGDAGPGTDLYGLGALAVALLTRREPNTLADTTGRLRWRAHANVSPGMAMLLDRLLEPDIDRRASGAEAVLGEVRRLRGGGGAASAGFLDARGGSRGDAAAEDGRSEAPSGTSGGLGTPRGPAAGQDRPEAGEGARADGPPRTAAAAATSVVGEAPFGRAPLPAAPHPPLGR
ncbi:MAG: serine/threonine-protein kinase, partial [Pseudomonadota bacterium]|nr:serine/threonine-protein kinase [Pseudomonadota bacterium]